MINGESTSVTGSDFEVWYGTAAGPVTDRIIRRVGDPILGRELAAEAFARAYEKWSRVGSMEAPEGWVYRTAINLSRRTWRRHQIERRALAKLEVGRTPPEFTVPEVSSTEVVVGGHTGGEVSRLVDELPPRMRDAVRFRYWEELSEAEVAERMATSTGAASASLSNARKRLKEDLRAERGERS